MYKQGGLTSRCLKVQDSLAPVKHRVVSAPDMGSTPDGCIRAPKGKFYGICEVGSLSIRVSSNNILDDSLAKYIPSLCGACGMLCHLCI
jgi:hypothetical protein